MYANSELNIFRQNSKSSNSKYESDLFKIIDCFIGGYGSLNSEHVNFSINF